MSSAHVVSSSHAAGRLPDNPSTGATWSVLLAGGEGARLSRLIRWFHSDGRPKQFATLIGTRSMLRHTFDRVGEISSLGRVLTVLTQGQESWARKQLPRATWENFLVQPQNLGTGPAVCLAVARVLAEDPHASVVIFPSDHFVHPEEQFEKGLSRVLEACDGLAEMKLVLLGAEPDGPQAGMGWMVPGRIERFAEGGIPLYEVERFAEKPSAAEARELLDVGALWNTFVIAGKARSFWYILWKKYAEAARRLEVFHQSLRRGEPPEQAARQFANVQAFDFCRDVLSRAPEHLLVYPLHGVRWRDWGTPEAFLKTIEDLDWEEKLDQTLLASELKSPHVGLHFG